MNTVTWNNEIEEALAAMAEVAKHKNPESARILQKTITLLKKTPLIISSATKEIKYSDCPEAFDSDRKPLFPFNAFRLDCSIKPDGTQTELASKAFVNVVRQKEKRLFEYIVFTRGYRREWPIALVISEVRKGTDDLLTEGLIRAQLWDVDQKKWLPNNEVYKQLIESTMINMNWILASLAADYMNPNLHSVKVSKKCGESRSMEWHQSREHYIFVHKNSPVNTIVANGRKFDPGSELNRMAHSRRAHYRLLTSPRYKAKRGIRVLVRSCWVGPKEWEDASGQIYKIVEHPNFQP